MRTIVHTALLAVLALPHAFAEDASLAPPVCRETRDVSLAGTVRDSTLALIPGATLSLENGETAKTGGDGRFRFPCVQPGAHHLMVSAEGFASNGLDLRLPHRGEVQVVLQPGAVTASVEVNADDQAVPDASQAGVSTTISGKQLQNLADDPDDLLRELQQLAAAAGGNPANTTIAVDGFQDSTQLPPKSSIAYIKVNPDQFSAEYREPPFDGGRVEVYTKPGQSTYHGALFATNGSPWMNARDPFSTSKAPLGKQRYGFELTGPIRKKGSDFALDLEHRSIDNYGVVNAVSLDGSGNPVTINANVATPQRLWVGEARTDWQLGQKNTLIASFTANVNSLENVGVGGTSLAETGYSSEQYNNTLRFVDVTTISPHLMHEVHVSFGWHDEDDVPTSTAPQVQVAGSFTGGGSTLGAQQIHHFVVEADDDVIWTAGHHTLKVGDQLITHTLHNRMTTNFNGTYTFGGGTAPVLDANNQAVPGETETISGIEQYRRALLNLPGGTPTAFSNTTGSPTVDFTQVREAIYAQDDWNVGHGVQISGGVRYFLTTNPDTFNGATPRLGVLWSPNKKGTWTLHAHAGMFTSMYSTQAATEVYREDGVNRTVNTIYNPVYGSPMSGSTPIQTVRSFSPHISLPFWAAENVGGTRMLPGGFNLNVDLYVGRIWNDSRSVNINSPLNDQPTGPRALGIPNLDLLQMNNSGQGRVNAEFVGIEQHKLKWLQFFFGGVHVGIFDDTDDNSLYSPQSAFTDAGEFARRDDQPAWNIFGYATLNLPKKIVLSTNFHGGGDQRYNILTGFDNNGDGVFNDRPQYAAPGTPGAVSTPYGLLVATGGDAVFPRDRGVMPWQYYLDTNLQRVFALNSPKADHPQTVTANIRSANVLNHTNVLQVGNTLGSPLFGVPYQADNGRRIEAGLRYSF